MKKKVISLLTSIVMAISTLGALSVSASEDESFGNAEQISVNSTVYDALLSSDDHHYYTFNLSANGLISISFGKEYDDYQNDKGWRVKLFNQYQEKIHEQEYETGDSVTETTGRIGLPKGKYYVYVEPIYKYRVSTVDYRLRVNYRKSSSWETEFNNSFDTADSISLHSVYYGTTNISDDVDYYKLKVSETSYFNVKFGKDYDSATYDKGWKITFYNANMQETDSHEINTGNSTTESFKVKMKAGTNYIKVTPQYKYKLSTVNYRLLIDYHISAGSITSFTGGKNSVTAKWNQVSGATGYKVRVSSKSNLSGGKVVYTNNLKTTIGGLVKGRKYYVVVRPYKKYKIGTKTYTVYGKTSAKKTTTAR